MLAAAGLCGFALVAPKSASAVDFEKEVLPILSAKCMKCHETYDPAEDQLQSMNCVTCHTNITDDHVFQATADPKSVVKPATPVTT